MLAKIKVLIVDDSSVIQKLYKGLLASDERFELIGVAENGKQAVELVEKLQPDVVSMDINMPIMNGIEATRIIMQHNPVPILIVSSLYQISEVEMAMEVLEAGAVSIMPKPHGPGHPKFEYSTRKYLNFLKSMSEIKVVKRRRLANKIENKSVDELKINNIPSGNYSGDYEILVIGASAGGPEGVKTILNGLHSKIPVPVLIVQHIDSHFAEGYCNWLQSTSNIPVQMVGENVTLLPGRAYLPPGDKHLVIQSKGIATVTDEPPVKGLRPAVATLFSSAAKVYNKNVIAVLLSGMGADGAAELKVLKDVGAFTLVQDQKSCLVFGMPGEAVKLGAALKVLSPQEIVEEINNMLIK